MKDLRDTTGVSKSNEQRWSGSTKRIVVIILMILAALVVYRFRIVIMPLAIAFLVAFILDPIVAFFMRLFRLKRGAATTLVFLILILAAAAAIVTPTFSGIEWAVEEITEAREQISGLITDISEFLGKPFVVAGYEVDLSAFSEDLSNLLRSFVSSVAEGTVNIATSLATGVFWLIVIVMASFYLVKDADRVATGLDALAPPGYREDFRRLRTRITRVWGAFLRGQLLLGVLMAAITFIICSILGLQYTLALALLAGVMEFVPSVGPFVAGIPAVLLALFQGTTIWGLDPVWYAVLITVVYLIIQQIEGNVLLPRVMGQSLNLHPLVVLIAIIFGGSLAGILGMLLAAPVVATIFVVGRYVFCRLYDRDPFAGWEAEEEATHKPGLVKRASVAVLGWLRERREKKEANAQRDMDSAGEGSG